MLKSEPTTSDVDAFLLSGGYVTTSPWRCAIYGFGGLVSYDGIGFFTKQCPNVLLVEKEADSHSSLTYAATQVGARTYVWNTVGLQGDPNSSIAIVDTGIDGSHVDFAPGYGNQDFSKKIVGWRDQIGSTTSPVDDNGHGSHCSGLSAGNGFFSMDASGNAFATYGANFGYLSAGTYMISGIMVNKTGPIAVNVKWARSGSSASRLSSLSLWYGDKTLDTAFWTQVASVSTPSQNTFYSLTYNVTSAPAGGYDMYHIRITATTGTSGSLYTAFNMTWPYMPPSDGFSAWTGMAPQAKLVGVKALDYSGSGTSTGLINGIDWIIANRMAYHITVVSMSLGFSSEVSAVDSAVLSLVNNGVTTVIAAGNSGAGANNIYTPGSVDETITVTAMNQFDNTASYSSQGGTSRYSGKTVKPDITAPGGSFYAVPLFSADSNYNDAEGEWSDIQANDSAPMQGTSMATPVVAGAANIVVQAMGGYAHWQWTRSQALQPKMILLMTATETYPSLRESFSSTYSATLDRGGKDVHEGYGRLNLDAAVDAVLKTYQIGTNVSDTLGMPPTLTDISVLGQRLAWASNVQLVSGFNYNFTISVSAGADYDLYLYNGTGTNYGEPATVVKSTTAIIGGTETFNVTAPYTGKYYLVVKRATETTGSGMFNLTSSGPVLETLNTPGLASASNVVHYVQNGTAKTGVIVASAFSDYADTGTVLQIDNPIFVSVSERYATVDPTSFAVQESSNHTVNYARQFYVSVTSAHDSPTASSWVNQGSNFTVSVTSPTDDDGAGTRYRCTGYTLDAELPITNGSVSCSLDNVNNAHTIIFNWVAQYLLYVSTDPVRLNPQPDRNPGGETGQPGGWWYDNSTTVTLTAQTVSGYMFDYIDIDGASQGEGNNPIIVTVNKSQTVIAHYTFYVFIDLNVGWNMVSFQVIPSNTSFSSIFSEVGFYQVLTWSGTSYISPTNAEAGRGYWVLVLSATTVNVTGEPLETYALDLPAGWSMIGSVYNNTIGAATVFPDFYQLLTWDGGRYVDSTTIAPGKGYWALVLEPTHIVVK
jgi:subtilisin family serine protease